jgi:hydrogenase-4 component B
MSTALAATFLAALVLIGASGVPGLFMSPHTSRGQRTATALLVSGAAMGLSIVLSSAMFDLPIELRAPWRVPGGEIHVEIDGISALFLLPIFFVSAAGSIYGLGYYAQSEHADGGRKLSCFYGLLTSGLALLVVSKNMLLFVMGWEIMALSAFLVLTTEDRDRSVREAGFLYLAATRASTLCLIAFVAVLFALNGSFLFAPPPATSPPALVTAAFILGLVGFGIKAGVMPLHVWLPDAHARAPSHVSAIMSGVLIKAGIYGMVRTCTLLDAPPLWWGELVLLLGAVSGVLGVAFAIGQHDIKRLLAYHSVENIGIITIGLGLATIGASLHRPDLILLGVGGALLHVVNHGLFKALLFLAAGSVIHATHTREIDLLGGLAKKMPRTALAFLVGAVAICGLPPLNGFVSELMIYLGLLRSFTSGSGDTFVAAALGAPALALIGALAVACFVKIFGAVFLGESRSAHTAAAVEAERSMTLPMALLAGACASIGGVPIVVAPLLTRAASSFSASSAGGEPLLAMAPFHAVTLGNALLVVLVAGLALAGLRWTRAGATSAVTWDCGYAAPRPTMQYTSSSFAEMIVRLFGIVLRPHVDRPVLGSLFPRGGRFSSHVGDPVLDEAVVPLSTLFARVATSLRWLQAGRVQVYLLYVLVFVLLLLLWR